MGLSEKEITEQSWAAYNQWRNDWIHNSKENKKYNQVSMFKSLEDIGRGKTLLILANGPSLGKHFDLIKKYRHKVHIACVDKTFKVLMNQGIRPDYVILCDANVSFDKYCDGLDTNNIALIANVCAEKNWVSYWKGPKFFFINKDVIKTENLFTAITDYAEYIPAASNVSNATIMICHFVLGYKWNLLSGYDYCWPLGSYYADGPNDKQYWMASQIYSDLKGNLVRASSNLVFSARWIVDFFKAAVSRNYVNCSEQGLLFEAPNAKLEFMLKKIHGESASSPA